MEFYSNPQIVSHVNGFELLTPVEKQVRHDEPRATNHQVEAMWQLKKRLHLPIDFQELVNTPFSVAKERIDAMNLQVPTKRRACLNETGEWETSKTIKPKVQSGRELE